MQPFTDLKSFNVRGKQNVLVFAISLLGLLEIKKIRPFVFEEKIARK